METAFKIGQKVRVADPLEGGAHFGIIEDITTDMFDFTPLYLVKIKALGAVKTYHEESLTILKMARRRR